MKSATVQKIDEGAYFIVDNLGYFNQITRFDLMLATQTISATPFGSAPPGEAEQEPSQDENPMPPGILSPR